MSSTCRICFSTDVSEHIEVPEQMFMTGESFRYERCRTCGCFQICALPEDLGRHYPNNYYSYLNKEVGTLARLKIRLRDFLRHYGPRAIFGGEEWWEMGAAKSLRAAHVDRRDRILDLGCGSGEFIGALRDIGFSGVLGVDPFIENDIERPNGVRILKREARDLDGKFEVVMMHHSLEHIWDQHEIAGQIARLLAPGGRAIVRIPTIDSWAFEEYGTRWVQLDAPRHLYLHSRQSIRNLLERAGLEVIRIEDDSGIFQILGSEKVRRGQPIGDRSHPPSRKETKAAWTKAKALNRDSRGDSIAVHARLAS
jgi:SAM-dependent methyltransferase